MEHVTNKTENIPSKESNWTSVKLPNKTSENKPTRKPNWLRVKLPTGEKYRQLRGLVDKYNLHTICTSGSCPNMGECWGEGTATFMILGNICTRSCKFCGVKTGRPQAIDWEEPEKVANSIKIMNIKHAVITSVDRDDLEDYGSEIWSETIKTVRRISPKTTMETLIPDFQGEEECLDLIIQAAPEVISHNVETVRRLTPSVRIQAKYNRSLEVLKYLRENGANRTKSGIMVGLGETTEEVLETMEDLKKHKVDVVTIGQYLQPRKEHLQVQNYVTPETFKIFETEGLKMGFRHVESGPLVRSSYKAHKHIN